MHRAGTHVVRSARGSTLVDEDGRELLDGLAGLWCVNVGYGREEILQAVAEQMRAVAFYPSFFNTTTEPAIRLAARLAELAPGAARRAIFSNSGSEANETALKLIRAYWKLRGRREKTKVLARTFALPRRDPRDDEPDRAADLHRSPSTSRCRASSRCPGPNPYGSGRAPRSTAPGASRRRSARSRARARARSRRCSSSRCRARAA